MALRQSRDERKTTPTPPPHPSQARITKLRLWIVKKLTCDIKVETITPSTIRTMQERVSHRRCNIKVGATSWRVQHQEGYYLMECATSWRVHRGVHRIWEGGGPRIFFFQIWEFACREAMRIARGFGGMLPRENFLKRCNLVRFRVYFDQILSSYFFKIYHFSYKKLIF